jgi:hypothetical protein
MMVRPTEMRDKSYRRPNRHLARIACGLAACLMMAATTSLGVQVQPTGDQRWAILVVGISGEPGLQKDYLKELVDLRNLLEGPLGFPRDHIVALFDDPKLDPTRIQYVSNRENLEQACRDIARRAAKDDTVFLFLEGHGDSDGKNYKLNLVGPDPTALELAAMLYAIPAQRFVIVNATNCSGASLDAFAGKGKIIVSATKSGSEKNLTHLGKYFIEALVNNNADVDKNGRVSVFEAFSYAAHKIEESYTKEGSLQTEHPVLSDNGDAQALSLSEAGARSTLPSRAAYLDRGSPLLLAADTSPESQALAREAQSLEKQIELLKSMKDEMPEADYMKKLEELLLKLAEAQAKLRKK